MQKNIFLHYHYISSNSKGGIVMQVNTINVSDKNLNKPQAFGMKLVCFDSYFYKSVEKNDVQEMLSDAFSRLNKKFPGDDYLLSGHGGIPNPNQLVFSVTNTKTGHPLSKTQTAVIATKESMKGLFKSLKSAVETLKMVNALPSYLAKLNKKLGTNITFTTTMTTPLTSKRNAAIFKKQLKNIANTASKIPHTPILITPAENNVMISLNDGSLNRNSISIHFMINPSKKEHNRKFIIDAMKKGKVELDKKVADEKLARQLEEEQALKSKLEGPKTKHLWDKNVQETALKN